MDTTEAPEDEEEGKGENRPPIRVRPEEKVLIDALIQDVGNRRLVEQGTAVRPTYAEAMEMVWDRIEELQVRLEELWEGLERSEVGQDHGLERGELEKHPFPTRSNPLPYTFAQQVQQRYGRRRGRGGARLL